MRVSLIRPLLLRFLVLCGFALLCAMGVSPALAGPATRIVVVLPGQVLVQGIGLVGAPVDQRQRVPFTVRVYAVDDSFSIDSAYQGSIQALLTDETVPTLGRRFGTSISHIDAATSLTNGTLRLSLNGSPFQQIPLGSPASGDEVCAAIVAGVGSVPAYRWGRAPALGCDFDPASLRFTLFLDDGAPVRLAASGGFGDLSITVDPAAGAAPILRLGVSSPSSDPDTAEELSAQRLDPPPSFATRFSRGIAFYEIHHTSPSGVGPDRMLLVDQSGGVALPVVSTRFRVLPSTLVIERVHLFDSNANGAFDTAEILFNQQIVPSSVPGNEVNFRLRLVTAGSTIQKSGEAIALEPESRLAYPSARLVVGFGTGVPTTSLDRVALEVLPGASSLQSAESGESFDPARAAGVRLIDGAPPVLLGTSPVDTNGDGAPDQLVFQFSEEIHFSAGRALSLGAFDPAPATTLPAHSSLRLATGGAAGSDHLLDLINPDDPGLPTIVGGANIARAITLAARRADPAPAWAHMDAALDTVSGRWVIRSGETGSGTSLAVLPSGRPDDAAPLLKLGVANGGIERPGSDADSPRIEDFVIVAPFGVNLLVGITDRDIVIDGNRLILGLNNSPAGAGGLPSYVIADNFDQGFIADLADEPNLAVPFNNLGLAPRFPPSKFIRIRDTDSAPDDGRVTASPGDVVLDASQTVVPLTGENGPSYVSFRWVQVSGPVTVSIADPTSPLTQASILRAGTYEFDVVLQVQPSTPSVFNPYVRSDGTLSRRFVIDVQPGGTSALVVVLPGQTLNQGVPAGSAVVSGVPHPQQTGVRFRVEAYAVDAFGNINFNESSSVPVTLSGSFPDPLAASVEAPKPLTGGTASFEVVDLRADAGVIFSASSPTLPGGPSSPVDLLAGPPERYVPLLPGEELIPGRALDSEAIAGISRIATAGVPYPVRLMVTDRYFNSVPPPPGVSARLTTGDPADTEPPAQPLISPMTNFILTPVTPGDWLVDDEVLTAFEFGDVSRPYVIGSLWNARAQTIPGQPGAVRFTWDPDPRPVMWNIYSGDLGPGTLQDADHDGLPDAGYGSCLTLLDPDPTDTVFEDLRVPATNRAFFYLGTMRIGGQETSLGTTSTGLERPNRSPCP